MENKGYLICEVGILGGNDKGEIKFILFLMFSENRDYKAVLSYNENLFVGGYFHSYLEKDDIILDIASNALYTSREDKEKVLDGEVLAKLTYDEVMTEFMKLLEEIPDLDPDDDKLQVLALHYGKKKGIK